MSAWVYVSPVCNTKTVLKQVRIWFKFLILWGSVISCWRNQLFSKMYVAIAESGMPSAVRKLESTKWCRCFQWLHCASSWSLLNVGLHLQKEVPVCSIRAAFPVSQAAAQSKVSTVSLLIYLCHNPKKVCDGEKQLHRAEYSRLQGEFLGTKNMWVEWVAEEQQRSHGNQNFLRSKRFKSFNGE